MWQVPEAGMKYSMVKCPGCFFTNREHKMDCLVEKYLKQLQSEDPEDVGDRLEPEEEDDEDQGSWGP